MRSCALGLALALALGCGGAAPDAPDAGSDGGPHQDSDAGPGDSGAPDAGPVDAGAFDAGAGDSGTPDAGTLDSGHRDAGLGPDAGGPRFLGTVTPVDAGAPLALSDAGWATVDLLGRNTVATTGALTLFDGGLVVAISASSLLVGEGVDCYPSEVNSWSCDYRWVSPAGTTLATLGGANGALLKQGDVLFATQGRRFECADPVGSPRALHSVVPLLVDADTGATRLSWPRNEEDGLSGMLSAHGDFIRDPLSGRSCDGGPPRIGPIPSTWHEIRAPFRRLQGWRADELGTGRILLHQFDDAGYRVTHLAADGGSSQVLSSQELPTYAEAHHDTFMFMVGVGLYHGDSQTGRLRPLFTRTAAHSGGIHLNERFASTSEVPPTSEIVIDSHGVLPDLRYPFSGLLLQRAPLLFSYKPSTPLSVARLDLGTAATAPLAVSVATPFPQQQAAVVIDVQSTLWLVDVDGVTRLTNRMVTVPQRGSTAPPEAPDLLMLVRRPSPGGPLQLLVADRRARRLVTLSNQVFSSTSGPFTSCGRPGVLYPGAHYLFFAETTAVAGQLNLYLAKSDLSEVPRWVGTTSSSACRVPVVSRDGARIAVEESLGGPTVVKVGAW